MFDNSKNSNSKSLHYFSSSSFTQSHDISLSLSHQKENTVPLGARWNEYDTTNNLRAYSDHPAITPRYRVLD